jgi:hypothetical protein
MECDIVESIQLTEWGTVAEFVNTVKNILVREISSSHGGEYDVQSCLLGYIAV